MQWASRWGLPRDAGETDWLTGMRVGRLAGRTAPEATATAIELLADWQMWLFLFDDQFCDESATGADPGRLGQVITAFTRILDNPSDRSCRNGPFTCALGDLTDRLADLATGQQAFRFAAAVRGYFLAQFWEAGRRAAGVPAGLAEYEQMRRHSGAVPTCMALMDMADGYELAAAEYYRADVRALTDIAVNVTCWANDILSYPKEAQRSLVVHSLPAVLAQERGLPVAQALRVAADLHDAEVQRFLDAERPVRRAASRPLRRYLDGLRDWMGGNFHWSLETGRYQVASEPDQASAGA